VKLAEMLIDELTEKKFDPLQYHDQYRERLLDRIKAKSEGHAIVSEEREEEKAGEVIDIMEALRRSLEGSGRAPAGRAPAKSTRAAATTTKRRTTSNARPTSRKRRAS
jgi:DNA end-binding protein Ku